MANLIYTAIASLDGCVADERGDFSWAFPSDELHAFVNDLERPIGTYLYGRRMYEVMVAWESPAMAEEESAVVRDYAGVWRSTDKVVYSRTLTEPSSERTRVERTFDPDEVRRMKSAADQDMSIGGPTLAAHAFAAGLVDECHLFLCPAVVGGGTRALPERQRIGLRLVGERRFPGGVVHLHYQVER